MDPLEGMLEAPASERSMKEARREEDGPVSSRERETLHLLLMQAHAQPSGLCLGRALHEHVR